jgi:hypothetical protein
MGESRASSPGMVQGTPGCKSDQRTPQRREGPLLTYGPPRFTRPPDKEMVIAMIRARRVKRSARLCLVLGQEPGIAERDPFAADRADAAVVFGSQSTATASEARLSR